MNSWHRQQPDPPRRAGIVTALAVAACVFPVLDAGELRGAEDVGGSSIAVGSVPILQYQGFAAPFSTDPASLDTALPWTPTYPDPRRIPASIERFISSPSILSTDPGAVPDTGGRSIATGSVPILQYQGFAAPFEVGTALEVQIAWYVQERLPDRVTRGITAAHRPAYTADKFTAPTAATVPDIPWTQPQLVHQRRTTLFRRTEVPTISEVVTTFQATLNWWPQQPNPVAARKRAPYVPGHQVFGVQVQVPVMSWTGLYLDPPMRRRERHQPEQRPFPIDVERTIQAIERLSWRPITEPRGHRAVSSHAALGAVSVWPHYVADVTVVHPTLSWQPRYDSLIIRGVHLEGRRMPFVFMDKFTAPTAVTVPDIPHGVYPNQIFRKTQASVGFRAHVLGLFELADTVAAITWSPTYPDSHPRPMTWTAPLESTLIVDAPPGWWWHQPAPMVSRPRMGSYLWMPSFFDFQDVVPELSWSPIGPDQHLSKPFLRAVVPWVFADTVTVPAVVTAPDLSIPVYPDRVYGREFHARLQRAFAFDRFTAPTPVIAPDLAEPVYVAFVSGRQPLTEAPAWLSQPYVSDVTDPAPGLSWEPVWPDFVWRDIFKAAAQQAEAGPVYVPDVTVQTPDLWTVLYPHQIHRLTPFPSGYVVVPMAPSLLDYIPPTADIVIVVRGDVGIVLVRPDPTMRVQ